MNKAFIFDMDGVIVDSESVWIKYEDKFLPELIGRNIYKKIKKQIIGNSLKNIYKFAVLEGLVMDENYFINFCHKYSEIVYSEAKITNGTEKILNKLYSKGYKLGIVSVSPQKWINNVLKNIRNKNLFQYILSLYDAGINPKPYPDGYILAMEKMNTAIEKTIILEDSQMGINAAKASGAFTICFKEHWPRGYKSYGADKYVKNMNELSDWLDCL